VDASRGRGKLPHVFHHKLLLLCLGIGVVFAEGAERIEDSPPSTSEKAESVESTSWSDPNDREHNWRPKSWKGWISVHIALPKSYEVSEVRLKMGDDPRWAQPDWDESDWEDATDEGLPTRAGIFWVRYRVRGPGKLPAGIYHKVCAAYDLYWDGRLIGYSGVPANNGHDEIPGKLDQTFGLPEEWRGPGEHVVALRMSTYRVGFPGPRTDLQVWFSTPENQAMNMSQGAIQPALAQGAMLMIALMSLVMWSVAARRATVLLFVGLCLCAAATQALTVQRFAYSYTYDWHYPARLAALYASGAMGACLLAFVGMHFAVPRWRWLLTLFVAVFAWVVFVPATIFYLPLSEKSGLVVLIGFIAALVATGWAYRRRRTGAWAAALGTLLGALAAWHTRGALIEGGGFFPMLLPVMLGLATAVALGLREERRQAHAAQLAAVRLETELLKKNLQPHFLLNTLTALSEVVEQDPAGAVRLINDLAGEFRSLTRMSGEKRVPLGQELDLCRAHLRVMSVRTKVAWSIDAEGVDEAGLVPPAMFLTLIENGFAHQRVSGRVGTFRLHAESRNGDGVRYTFLSPGEVRTEPARAPGGTGLRYVRARLEESFPGAWALSHQATADGWETVIELRDTSEQKKDRRNFSPPRGV
jgi:hypothetical protein